MNALIHEIIEDMTNRCKKDALNEADKQTYLMVQSARLSVLLAREDEIRGKEVSEQTQNIINLTRAIYILTAVMVIVGVIQIIIALKFS